MRVGIVGDAREEPKVTLDFTDGQRTAPTWVSLECLHRYCQEQPVCSCGYCTRRHCRCELGGES